MDSKTYIPVMDPLDELKSSWGHSWQLLLEPPTSPSSKITVYTTTHILPILLPALISLSHAIENGGGHDISPPTPDLGTREQSTELKVFFARNLAKPIAKAIEDCYEKQPNDPGDHMAKFFFDRSSDEPLNPEFDDQVNPLDFLGQYFMRHNPLHTNSSPFHSTTSQQKGYTPSKRPIIPPHPNLKSSSHKTSSTTPSSSGLTSTDLTREVVGITTLTIPSVGPSNSSMQVTVTAIRHLYNETVLFRAIDKATYKKYDRILTKNQLLAVGGSRGSLGGRGGKERGYVEVIERLLSLVTLVRVCRGLQVSFKDSPDLSTPPPTLYQTSVVRGGRAFIVDIIGEPMLGGNQGDSPRLGEWGAEGEDEEGEVMLLRFRVYDPEFSRYYEAHANDLVPPPGDARRRKKALRKAVDRLVISEVDQDTGRPMRFSVAEKGASATGVTDAVNGLPIQDMRIDRPPPPIVSPRLKSAINTARAMDEEVNRDAKDDGKGVSAEEYQGRYPGGDNIVSLREWRFAGENERGNPGLDRDEVDKRESVWQLRRDFKVQERQKVLQKRSGGGSKNGVCILKRGMKVSGRRVILSVECLKESIDGHLRFTAYDPATSEGFDVTEKHIDTRGLIPDSSPGDRKSGFLSGGSEFRVMEVCRSLRLVRGGKGRGPLELIVFGTDELLGRIRLAFEKLPADSDGTGRVAVEDIIDMLEVTREEAKKVLEGVEDVVAEEGVRWIEEALGRIREMAWNKVSLREFEELLGEGTGIKGGGGKRKRKEGEEQKESEKGKESEEGKYNEEGKDTEEGKEEEKC